MARLEADFTSRFKKDYKRLRKSGVDVSPLHEVFELVLSNTLEAREELIRRHRMHTLSGKWGGSNECHVCNAGDWLLVWYTTEDLAVFQRTGTHDEIFK